jgi:subtilisin family serine protease
MGVRPAVEVRMPRFVLASRRFSDARAAAAVLKAADGAWRDLFARSATEVFEATRGGPRPRYLKVFEAPSGDVERMAGRLPTGVFVEPEIMHDIAAPLAFAVQGGAERLAGVHVIATVRDADGHISTEMALTDADGVARFDVDASECIVDLLVVHPLSGFWSRVVGQPAPGEDVQCESLPLGPRGWWHEFVGVAGHDLQRGKGVKVGIVDTGVGPNACLEHAEDLGAIVDGVHDASAGADVHGHGTHVAGLVGARPVGRTDFPGIAPGCSLASVRVCPEDAGTNQVDIVSALELLTDPFAADLINLSLAAPKPSQVLHDGILDCLDAGILCLCAAGNTAEAVRYPAAFPEAVAVSALGRKGCATVDSVSAGSEPANTATDEYGREDAFLARFSCRGEGVFCAAPGVAIISTVPAPPGEVRFGVMDGTSMASPIACAVLAARLSKDRAYRAMTRGPERAERARAVLRAACHDLGLASEYQGHGVPRLATNARRR